MIANLSTRLAGCLAGKRQAGFRPAEMRLAAAALLAFAVAAAATISPAISPAWAQMGPMGQDAPPPAPPLPQVSPASLLIAKQILQVKNVQQVFDPMIRGIVEKTKEVFLQTNFMWSKDLNEVAFMVEKQMQPRSAELVDATARYYASHFTEQELRDLLTFYQSPLGRKTLAEEPKALDDSMAYAGNWANSLVPEVMTAMRVEMKKRGHDM
jgi:hypothetical protein